MAKEISPIIIKKYANRRLYNTKTSAYITLDDLAASVKRGEDFVVYDAKTGEDITRSVLTQIIFEQEGKNGQSLLPITFLRQLIRFYGDSMQMLVPSYLEFTIGRFASEQAKFREKIAKNFGGPLTTPIFESIEEQARKNMALFEQALAMFSPFGKAHQAQAEKTTEPPAGDPPAQPSSPPSSSDLDEMKRQLDQLQKRIETLLAKESK
jgi:polyhydroxyalkanoate synthesis repressor PhaR